MPKILIIMLFTLTACTHVHHVQVGSIDNTVTGIPIEIVVKTVGIDAAKLTKTIENITQQGNQKNKKNKASDIVGLFQTGPRTGAPIYDQAWGEKLMRELHLKCPSARLKNIHSLRLATDYADTGVTQEIVVIKAVCIRNI